MPAGIENFALGLVQGMNARKAEQRQSEQDAMRKQEFNLQQQARQFDLENARTNAVNSKTDRDRTLALQARGDAFNKHMALAMSAGDDDSAIMAMAEGFNDPVFGMPYKAVPQTGPDGKLFRDAEGRHVVQYLDPSGKVSHTQSWARDEALARFAALGDSAKEFDLLRKNAAERKKEESERAHDMAKIDRSGEWDVKKAGVAADAALNRALSVLDRRAELGLGRGEAKSKGLGRDEAKSKYSLDGEIKSLFVSDADASPLSRRVIVQQIDGGISAAAGSKDVRDRVQGWNQAYQGFLGAVRSADVGRELSPRQIEEQAKLMFDKHLRETYGVGYDDAMTQLGLVDPKTLPNKGRAQQSSPAGGSFKTPAQTLIDPVKQASDTKKAYQNANNFITGGGF